MTGPGDEEAVAAAGRGYLRASDADRDQMIDMLAAALGQGRLTRDEFDARMGQALASRTYADLAAVTAGIPARPAAAQPNTQPQRRVGNAARWGASGVVTPAILAAAFALISVPGDGGYAAMAFVIAFGYFVFWLSAGVDMLWQWHSMSVPKAGMCVRCAHTAASHHAPASCAVRLGSLKMQGQCPCTGYVPPGKSPRTTDLHLQPTRSW